MRSTELPQTVAAIVTSNVFEVVTGEVEERGRAENSSALEYEFVGLIEFRLVRNGLSSGLDLFDFDKEVTCG